ncbi:MAG TPA: NRDE family protein [Micromonosporaceae bacterium]|nr:NRDE family protein [Micromonosporaceae bacterium]
MCTVLLRFAPGTRWPLLLAAVRDEFVGRPWDPPAAHWPDTRYVGGRDRVSGGTWLAVRPGGPPAVAALLNGVRLPPPANGVRHSRGDLPLAALAGAPLPAGEELRRYDGFHLLVGTATAVTVSTWDGTALTARAVVPGDHIVVNDGVDVVGDPLVPYFAPVLAGAATPDPEPGLSTAQAWGDWVDLLTGDGLARDDPRALIVAVEHLGQAYGSTSATLVALGGSAVRYDFTADPGDPSRWTEVALAGAGDDGGPAGLDE